MPTGPQGQKILYTTLFMGKVCRKNPGFDKDKTDVMFGLTVWLWIFHFPLCTSQGIKVPFENKVMGLAHRSLVSPCHSFFPFPSFSLSVLLSGWLLGTRELYWLSVFIKEDQALFSALLSLSPKPSSWGYPWILLGLELGTSYRTLPDFITYKVPQLMMGNSDYMIRWCHMVRHLVSTKA